MLGVAAASPGGATRPLNGIGVGPLLFRAPGAGAPASAPPVSLEPYVLAVVSSLGRDVRWRPPPGPHGLGMESLDGGFGAAHAFTRGGTAPPPRSEAAPEAAEATEARDQIHRGGAGAWDPPAWEARYWRRGA